MAGVDYLPYMAFNVGAEDSNPTIMPEEKALDQLSRLSSPILPSSTDEARPHPKGHSLPNSKLIPQGRAKEATPHYFLVVSLHKKIFLMKKKKLFRESYNEKHWASKG